MKRSTRRRRSFAVCISLAAAIAATATGSASAAVSSKPSTGCFIGGPNGASEQLLTLTVGGTARMYDLILPSGYTNSTPQAVYFVFHGRDSDYTSVTPFGLQSNAIGVFPNGLDRNGTIGWDTSVNGTDVAMFDAVLSSVTANYCVDTSRVYAAGFSFGASMANALGCFRSNVLRGFASVEGGILFGNGSNDCKGPIPGWINQYQQDPTVSFATGQMAEEFFVALNSDSNPQPYDAPNPCVIYTGNAPLVWCTPEGAEHAWPPYATASIQAFFATNPTVVAVPALGNRRNAWSLALFLALCGALAGRQRGQRAAHLAR
jgi:polyhydroxybutyrate depolymerase